jgi:hypothetical protein
MKTRNHETFDRVEVLDTGELLVGLSGAGSPTFQYVRRAAAGVYWEPTMRGFKSTPMREWSASQWFSHILSVVRSEVGIELVPADAISFKGVSEMDKREIQQTASRTE